MSIIEAVCNWISQVMRYLDILWRMIINMLHHDFQTRYGRPPEIIILDEPDPGLGHGGIEVIDEVHPISTYFVEHKNIRHRTYADDSSSDESESNSILVPIMDPIRYLQCRDEYSNAIVIESKVILNISNDNNKSDKIKQGSSKM